MLRVRELMFSEYKTTTKLCSGEMLVARYDYIRFIVDLIHFLPLRLQASLLSTAFYKKESKMCTGRTKQSDEVLNKIGYEEEDIAYTMRDEAEFSRNWINDCLLRQYSKKAGEERLSVNTRKLIKVQSYNEYLRLGKELHRKMKEQAQTLLDEIKDQ